MIVFWSLAAVVSSLAAVLILARAAGAERAAPAANPVLTIYRRQLEEIDELAERGLLGADEHRSARAETARRLLGEADRSDTPAMEAGSKGSRRLVVAAAALAPLVALGGYLLVGSPGNPDQPYKQRLEAWRADPSKLDLPRMQAVLEAVAAERPKDPQALIYLAGAQAAAGDAAAAARTLEKAVLVAPNDPRTWTALGEALFELAQGEVTPDARAAFERARSLDPAAPAPRYYLARVDLAAGRIDAGLEQWRALAAALPAGDSARTALEAEIADVVKAGRLPEARAEAPGGASPDSASTQGGQQAAFIQSMVDRLAARLKAQPDDPAGWARLIRAYGVLGQADRRAAAIAEARRLFAKRPDALRTALAGEAPAPR